MMSRRSRAGRAWLRTWLCGSTSLAWLPHTGLAIAAIGSGILCSEPVQAGQLSVSDFQPYNAANASSIPAGPFSLYTVPVDQLQPTQMNEGFTEVNKKTDRLRSSCSPRTAMRSDQRYRAGRHRPGRRSLSDRRPSHLHRAGRVRLRLERSDRLCQHHRQFFESDTAQFWATDGSRQPAAAVE